MTRRFTGFTPVVLFMGGLHCVSAAGQESGGGRSELLYGRHFIFVCDLKLGVTVDLL
jgi:hypothetical protein